MLTILAITAPIFILIGLGFASSRFGLFSKIQIAGLGSFVINIALPALIVKALGQKPIGEVFDIAYLTAYGLGSLAIFALGLWFSFKVRQDNLASSTISALGMSTSNSAFIGYPIVAMVLGPPAAVALALCILIENLIMLPLALILSEGRGAQRGESTGALLRNLGKRMVKNPIIIAITVGLALSLTGLSIGPILAKVIDMLAMASAPIALFVIGASLYGLKPGGVLADMVQVSVGKLVLHPLAVFLAFFLVPGVTPEMKAAGVLIASAPMMSIYPIIGQRVGLESRCAAALVCATVMSFISITLWVAFIS